MGWACIPRVKNCCCCVNVRIGAFLLIPLFVPPAAFFLINSAVPYCPELYEGNDKLIIFLLLIISGVLAVMFLTVGILGWFAVCLNKSLVTNLLMIIALFYTMANAAYWIYAVMRMSSIKDKCTADGQLKLPWDPKNCSADGPLGLRAEDTDSATSDNSAAGTGSAASASGSKGGGKKLLQVYMILAAASILFMLLWFHFACVLNSLEKSGGRESPLGSRTQSRSNANVLSCIGCK